MSHYCFSLAVTCTYSIGSDIGGLTRQRRHTILMYDITCKFGWQETRSPKWHPPFRNATFRPESSLAERKMPNTFDVSCSIAGIDVKMEFDLLRILTSHSFGVYLIINYILEYKMWLRNNCSVKLMRGVRHISILFNIIINSILRSLCIIMIM